MKNFKMLMSFGFAVLMMSACGDNKSSTSGTTVANSCAVGSVSTAYGCVPSGNCPSGYGMYNGSCIVGTMSNNVNYPVATGCTAGQVNTQYGCVAQGACPSGYGMYNNSCIVATNTGYNNGYNPGYSTGMNMNTGCTAGSYNVMGYGCLPQGPCYSNQVYYMNQCVNLIPYNKYNAGFQFRFVW